MGSAALLLAIALTISGCEKSFSSAGRTDNNTSSTAASSAPIAGKNPAPDNSGDWVRPARDSSSTRFSPLNQITTENAKQLIVKATFSTGVLQEVWSTTPPRKARLTLDERRTHALLGRRTRKRTEKEALRRAS